MTRINRKPRIIIITGANNGIGLAMLKSLAQGGDCVAGLDLSLSNLDTGDPNYLGCICDVRDPHQVQATITEIIQHWGRVDILINNACMALYTRFEERLMEDIRQEFEVNYYGYLNLIRAVLPFMKKQGHGVIHNVSSAVGFTGMPGMIGYTSTKGSIEAMTRTLALEYAGQGIVFNVMHPPLTRTNSAAGFGIPLEMMADPEIIGRRLAKLVGKTNPVLVPGLINKIQFLLSYHLRMQMGKLMSIMADRARRSAEADVE